MNKLRRIVVFLSIAGLFCMASAQETATETAAKPEVWDLQGCIDYALRQNITIRQSRLNAESSEVDVQSARADYLPSVSASVGQRIVNRPKSETNTMISGDQITSTQSKTSYNGSYGVDVNWTLFNGSRANTVKQQKVNNQIANLSVEQNENAIIESIVQNYVQILYSAEAVKVNEETVAVSQANYQRGEELLKAGSISKVDLAQLKSQVSADKYQLVNAQTALENYKLQLKQLLELDGEEEMKLYIPQLSDDAVLNPLPLKADIYKSALMQRPEIAQGKLNVEASDLDIKIARAGYMPRLSLSAGVGTTNANGNDYSFSEQVKTNWNNSLGLTLSIPIFDKRQTKSSIQKAKLQRQMSELALQDEQKTLYKTIEGLWLDANNAQQQYASATEKVNSSQVSFDLMQEQFRLGMKNTVELLTEKNTLFNALQEKLQAKYTAILSQQLLKFYQGEKISI